jgi:uncharacterized protein (TIGR02147 family)
MEALDLPTRPNVFEYSDYRLFLGDTYHYLKTRFTQFSFRFFSRRAGFASPNFLKLVIEGKRNISPASIPRFTEALKLSKSEAEFFTHLVQFNQSKNPSQRAESAKGMLQCKGFQKIYPLRQAEYAYYANWYYIPVRELACLSHFREDPKWISQAVFPAITELEAAQALRDLESLGLLIRDISGRLIQARRTVSTENEVSSAAIARYHKDMLNMASESIDRVPRERREISAACVPLSKAAAAKAKEMIQAFRNEILTMASEDSDPDTVYQINMQLFPLSRWAGEGEDQ